MPLRGPAKAREPNMKSSHRIKVSVGGACLAVLALSVAWRARHATVEAAPEKRQDGMDKAMKLVTEKGAANCGQVGPRDDRSAADACGVASFKAKKPFHVRYDLQGIDSYVAEGMVGNSKGQLYIFSYDSDPSGGSNVGERVGKSLCAHPKIVTKDGKQHLECG